MGSEAIEENWAWAKTMEPEDVGAEKPASRFRFRRLEEVIRMWKEEGKEGLRREKEVWSSCIMC